ncbi:hypothetical protein [Legionella gresilensis]|uniref:hypothetical protein n=1 Tax=Legionella gresilensis TaxID=91823 RepID=UPI0013EFB209|nr:hypothetical protein [Legionella gresilensis]
MTIHNCWAAFCLAQPMTLLCMQPPLPSLRPAACPQDPVMWLIPRFREQVAEGSYRASVVTVLSF